MRSYVICNHINCNAAGYACCATCTYTYTNIFNTRCTISINSKVINMHCAAVYRSIGLLDNAVNGYACTYTGTTSYGCNIGGAGNFAVVLRVNSHFGICAVLFFFINISICNFCTCSFVNQRGCRCALYSHITCTANADCHVDYSCFVFSFNFNRAVCTVRINSAVFNFCRYMLFGFLFIIRNTADFRIGNACTNCCLTGDINRTDNRKNIRIIGSMCYYFFSIINFCAIHNSTGSAFGLRYHNRAAYGSFTGCAYACADVVAIAGVVCFSSYACSFICSSFIKFRSADINFGSIIKPNVTERCAYCSFACAADLTAYGNNLRLVGRSGSSLLRMNMRIFNVNIGGVYNVVPAYAANAAAFIGRSNAARNGNNVTVAACVNIKLIRSNISVLNISRVGIFNIGNGNSRAACTFAGRSSQAARNGNNAAAGSFTFFV